MVNQRVEGGRLAVPRKKGPGYTWASVHLPKPLHDAIARVALDEDRSISGMIRRLSTEALRARGINVPDGQDALENSPAKEDTP